MGTESTKTAVGATFSTNKAPKVPCFRSSGVGIGSGRKIWRRPRGILALEDAPRTRYVPIRLRYKITDMHQRPTHDLAAPIAIDAKNGVRGTSLDDHTPVEDAVDSVTRSLEIQPLA